MAKGKKVLTTGDVARICQVAPRTVSKWFDSGQLRGYRIPGSKDRRIPVDELARFMKRHNMPIEGQGVLQTRILLIKIAAEKNVIWENDLEQLGGYEVKSVDDFFQAGIALQRFSPHVVVLDMSEDLSKGLTLCATIYEDEEFQGTRIIALTCSQQSVQNKKIMATGVDACLVDCEDIAELIKCVEHVTAIYY